MSKTNKIRRFLQFVLAVILATMGVTAALGVLSKKADAANLLYVAGSGSDSGHCDIPTAPCKTVSYALSQATSGDTINVSPTNGTIFDHVTIPTVLTNLTITSSGPGSAVVDGGGTGTVFDIQSGASATISGLTIQNGYASVADVVFSYVGGGIANYGNLTLSNDIINSNDDNDPNGFGGGIANAGTLTITNSTVSNDTAHGVGGGIASWGTTVTSSGNTYSNNYSNGGLGGGGAIAVWSGHVQSTSDTFLGNHVPYNSGGAVVLSNGSYQSTADTYSGNQAKYGGAIYLNGGQFQSLNDTMTGNVAVTSGGAIYQHTVSSTLTNDTIAENGATYGTDIYADAMGLQLSGTIIANSNVTGDCAQTVLGAFEDLGWNLGQDSTCPFTAPGSVTNVDPLLVPLGNYGGPTETMPPASESSPAFNRVPLGAPGCPGTDQRGIARPDLGTQCTIGAAEVVVPVGNPFTYDMLPNHTLTEAAPGVLTGATDPNVGVTGLTAQEVTGPANGTLSLSANGSLVYTPTHAYHGSDSFTYTVTDNWGFVSPLQTVTVNVGPNIKTPSPLPAAVRGVVYSTTLQVTGGTGPYKWKKLSRLPKGLKLNKSTGVITGIPSTKVALGVYPVTIQVTDHSKPTHLVGTKTFTITIGALPNLYVSDNPAGTITRVTPNGTKTTVISGLNRPNGVADDAAGNLYVSESGRNQVDKFSKGIETVLLTGLSQPSRLAVDRAGDLFVADTGNHRVVEASAGGTVSNFGSSNLTQPIGMAVNASGDVFVTDSGTNKVVEFGPGGALIGTVAATLNLPNGIATDSAGNLYVADYGDSTLQKISSADVQSGIPLAGLNQPNDVAAVDGLGILYVADYTASEVVEYPPGGPQTTIAFPGANSVAVGP